MSKWPTVARSLVAGGFNSPQLIDFAGLDATDGAELAGLLPDVLRSLGLTVAEGPPFYPQPSRTAGAARRRTTR